MFPGLVSDLVGQRLHVVGACPRVYLAGDGGLLLDVDLRVAGDAGGEVRRQRDGLVQGVGVQRLRVAEGGAHGLDGGAGHVVERVLFGERPSRCLAVRAQGHGFRVLRVELAHDLGPQEPGGTHLGDLHEVVHAHAPEEREAGCELVHGHAGVDAGADVLQTVGQRVGQLDIGRGARLLHVVAGDGDGVELGHVLGRVLENVGDDPHGEFGRVDVGVAHHELLEDVVLDRSGHLIEAHALFESGNDVEGEYRKYGAVHRHRNGHLVERYAFEEHLHVLHGAYRNARFAHVAHYARMVGVIAAVGGQVERHRKSLLPGGEVAAVEGVALLGGREARILADGPRTHHVHRAVGAAQEGGDTCRIVEVFESFEVLFGVSSLDGDLLGGHPHAFAVAAFSGVAAFGRPAFVCQC